MSVEDFHNRQKENQKRNARRTYVISFLVLFLASFSFITPNKGHKESFELEFEELSNEAISKYKKIPDDPASKVAQKLGSALNSMLFRPDIEVHNYWFFSTSYITIDGVKYKYATGFLTQIFKTDDYISPLDKKIKDLYQKDNS